MRSLPTPSTRAVQDLRWALVVNDLPLTTVSAATGISVTALREIVLGRVLPSAVAKDALHAALGIAPEGWSTAPSVESAETRTMLSTVLGRLAGVARLP